MKLFQFVALVCCCGLIACNNPETNTANSNFIEDSLPAQQNNNVPTSDSIIARDSASKNINSTNPVVEKARDKNAKKDTSNGGEKLSKDMIESVGSGQNENQSNIIPGFVKNVFTKKGSTYYFKRIVKNDEDTRKGGSGGGSDMSFEIENPASTFLIENEKLKTINFKYRINGEIYESKGENPHKGKIKGTLLPDNTWQLEMHLFVAMTDMQLNKEMERKVIVNGIFIP